MKSKTAIYVTLSLAAIVFICGGIGFTVRLGNQSLLKKSDAAMQVWWGSMLTGATETSQVKLDPLNSKNDLMQFERGLDQLRRYHAAKPLTAITLRKAYMRQGSQHNIRLDYDFNSNGESYVISCALRVDKASSRKVFFLGNFRFERVE